MQYNLADTIFGGLISLLVETKADESSNRVTWLFSCQRKARSKSDSEENLSLALWGDLCHSVLEIKEVVQQYYAVLTLELRLQFKVSYKLLICRRRQPSPILTSLMRLNM